MLVQVFLKKNCLKHIRKKKTSDPTCIMNITIETLPIAVPTFRYSFAMYMNDNYTIQLHIQASVPLISCIEVNGLLGRRRFHPCGALESCSSNYMTYNLP